MRSRETREDGMRSRRQQGFSLVELMIAMVATLIVSAAIYGVLASGQDSFRREPEIADMQQNLRMAMDLIMRDVAAAGEGIPAGPPGGEPPGMPFVQIFVPDLDDLTVRPLRPQSTTEHTDDLDMITSSSDCGAERLCGYKDEKAANIRTINATTCVDEGETPIFFMDNGTWTTRYITNLTENQGTSGNPSWPSSCPGGKESGWHKDLHFPAAKAETKDASVNNPSPADLCGDYPDLGTTTGDACIPLYVMDADRVTYRVVLGADGVPNLERRSTRGLGGAIAAGFQVVARGIEDLQVEYATADDPETFVAGAPTVASPDYGTIITQVRVTLAGRTTAINLAGQMADARGQQFIRSSLTSTGAVRSALLQLALEGTSTVKWQ